MDKLMVTVVGFFITLGNQGFAAEPAASPCLAQISAINSYPLITPSVLACMKAKFTVDQVTDSVKVLCNADEKNLSAHYLKYRQFEIKSKALWDQFSASTDAASRLNLENQMQNNDTDWMIIGFQGEIAGSLQTL